MADDFLQGGVTRPEGDAGRRFLVPRARRSVPVLRFLLIPGFGALYATVAMLHPIFGSSPESILILSMLGMLALGYALMSPNADLLDPMRVVSFYFLIVFCLAPLAMRTVDWHFTRPYVELLPPAVAYCACSYLAVVVGYHLPIFRKIPSAIEARSETFSPRTSSFMAMGLFSIGLASWLILFFLAGGLNTLVYSDRARGEFFEGFGYFFWGALLMFPGATLYWASKCVGRSKPPWVHALPTLVAFGAFLMLQGRMRALNFLVLALFVSHYLIRPLKASRLGVYGVAGLSLALFVGFVRAPSTRTDAFEDPVSAIVSIFRDFNDVIRAFVTADFSRLSQIALIMDKVPSWIPYQLGKTFFIFSNPWLRLFGLGSLQVEGVDSALFRLAHPEAGPRPTGYLPSVVGEMIFNFPWPIAILLFVPYGIALRWMYAHLIVNRGDFVAVALYAILLLQAANIVLQSFGHVVFEMMIVLLPILMVQLVARRRGSRFQTSGAVGLQ